MKRIRSSQMDIPSLASPLNEIVELQCVGGRSLEQWHYMTPDVYYPNRRTSALTLRPVVRVSDTDTARTYTPALTGSLWYYRRHGDTSWTQVTNTTESLDAPFTVKSNHDLVVRANFTTEIRCDMIYADPRTSGSVNTSAHVTLITNEDADSVYNVHIITGKAGYEYSPLTEESSRKTFLASATLGSSVVTDNVLFQWYTSVDGQEVLISTSDPVYVSGQGTSTLVLDALFADKYPVILRMKRDASALLEPCRDQLNMMWRVPTVFGDIYSPQGNSVKNTDSGQKEFGVLYRTNTGDISADKISDHLIIKWSRRNSAGAYSSVGVGPSIRQAVDNLRTNGDTSTLMQAEAYLRGPYVQVVQNAPHLETAQVTQVMNGSSYRVIIEVNSVKYLVTQQVSVTRTFKVVQNGHPVMERP